MLKFSVRFGERFSESVTFRVMLCVKEGIRDVHCVCVNS